MIESETYDKSDPRLLINIFGAKMKTAGKIKQKLLILLNEAGLDIPDTTCFWTQLGFYRFRYHDLARWGADWGKHNSCYSWSTMTECVRYGLTVSCDGRNGCEVSSLKTYAQQEADNAKAIEKRNKERELEQQEYDRQKQRRLKRRAEFRIYRCTLCDLQFPCEPGHSKACWRCKSEEHLNDVTNDII